MKEKELLPMTLEVAAVKEIAISGHVVPLEWFQHIKRPDGRPDANAVLVYADIVAWYRPKKVASEEQPNLQLYGRWFEADILQRSYSQISSIFGFTKKEARNAVDRLRDLGLIKTELRVVKTNIQKLHNVMFIRIVPEMLRKITHHPTPKT